MTPRFLTAIDDDRGTFKIEFFMGRAFLHAQFKQKLSAMRAAHEVLLQVKSWLKAMGHKKVFVRIHEGDSMTHRFERMFGFREISVKDGVVLMGQEC